MKQCVPGQRVGGQAGAPGVSKAQAAGGVLVLLPPISEASTQGPVASASLRLWAEILSFKPWAPDGVGGGVLRRSCGGRLRGLHLRFWNQDEQSRCPRRARLLLESLHPLPAPGATVVWSTVTWPGYWGL